MCLISRVSAGSEKESWKEEGCERGGVGVVRVDGRVELGYGSGWGGEVR